MEGRLEKVAQIIAQKGYGSVTKLATELGVSEMTVRRDLEKLEKKRLIKRTHGGAYAEHEMVEVDYRVRETLCRDEKEAIGRKACTLIESGDSVFIDAGTTTFFLASAIDNSKRFAVVTNSLVVAQTLEDKSNVETILIGGKISSATHSLIGPIAEEAITQFKYTKAFLGTGGINLSEGLTHSTLEEASIKKQAAANAQKVIVLADHTKFNKDVFALFMGLDEIDMIITDSGSKESDRAILKQKNIEVIVV